MPLDWDKLKSFHASAETGSLTAAGDKLNISQSAVSRHISSLEEQVGTPLFQRHARGLILTESGHTLHRATSEMAASAAIAQSALRDVGDTPQGDLIVNTPRAFGSFWLSKRLSSFTSINPKLRLNLYMADREFDLLTLEAECAIRLQSATQADIIQRRLCTMHTHLYASEKYLEDHGEPSTPSDLDRHRLIGYVGDSVHVEELNWARQAGREDQPPRDVALAINSVFAIAQAVSTGQGVAALPDYIAHETPGLKKVMPHLPGPSFDVFFIYPSDLRRSNRIAAFRDFITREIKAWEAWEDEP